MNSQRIFLAPDNGPSGSPSANQGGAQTVQGDSTLDPFAGIDLEDLDPATKGVLEKAKASFASLQKERDDTAKAKAHMEQLAREFQGKHDSLAAQLQKLTTGRDGQTVDDPKTKLTQKFTEILIARNVPPEQAKLQAPLMAEMMGEFGSVLKGEIGASMAPFAGSVLMNEANQAWQQALQTDRFGALQIPEVANAAWAQVESLVNNGQQVTPATIKNLSSMFYIEHCEKTGVTPGQSQQPPAPTYPMPGQSLPNFGTAMRYPGAGNAPQRPQQNDPNAPKYSLDPATNAALQSVMGNWDVKPKAFQGSQQGGRR